MDYDLQLVTAPLNEPITLADAKRQVRLEASEKAFDDELALLISAARRWAELATARCFIEQTWDLVFMKGFPFTAVNAVNSSDEIRIPRAPLKAAAGITHLKYLDTDGAQQTLLATKYDVVSRGGRALLVPVYGTSWPSTRNWPTGGNYPLEVRFIAGYGPEPTAVPENFRNAMLLHVEAGYDRDPDHQQLLLDRAEALLAQDRFIPR